MTEGPTFIYVTATGRPILIDLLRAARDVPAGGVVIDALPLNPWGDIGDFRGEIYLPLHGSPASASATDTGHQIQIPPGDVAAIRDIVDALGESVAGGVPWILPSPEKRGAVKRLLARVDALRP